MSPIEFLVAAYHSRRMLRSRLLLLLIMAAVLTYHAMTDPLFDWLMQ